MSKGGKMKLKAVPVINGCKGCVFDVNKICIQHDQEIDGKIYNCCGGDIVYVEDKEIIEVKKLTPEELKRQFEKEFKKIGEYTGIDFNVDSNGEYKERYMYIRWQGFLQCAKANGILKDEEI